MLAGIGVLFIIGADVVAVIGVEVIVLVLASLEICSVHAFESVHERAVVGGEAVVLVLVGREVPVLGGIGVLFIIGADVVAVIGAEVIVLVVAFLEICSGHAFESVHERAVVGGEAVVLVLVFGEVPMLKRVGVVAFVGVDVVVLALCTAPAGASGEALVIRMYVAALWSAAVSMVHRGAPRSTISANIGVRSAQHERWLC